MCRRPKGSETYSGDGEDGGVRIPIGSAPESTFPIPYVRINAPESNPFLPADRRSVRGLDDPAADPGDLPPVQKQRRVIDEIVDRNPPRFAKLIGRNNPYPYPSNGYGFEGTKVADHISRTKDPRG